MSARAHPGIASILRPRSAPRRAPSRRLAAESAAKAPPGHRAAKAALLVAGLAAWALYATPPQRWPAYAALHRYIGALAPADRGLKFGDVSARRAQIDGQTVLYVEGSVVNTALGRRKTPALRITLIGDDGQPLYSWKSKAARPEMEATAAFQTRLLSPPEKFRNIAISFADEG